MSTCKQCGFKARPQSEMLGQHCPAYRAWRTAGKQDWRSEFKSDICPVLDGDTFSVFIAHSWQQQEPLPANKWRWTNAGLRLGQRRRRWPHLNSALGNVSCLQGMGRCCLTLVHSLSHWTSYKTALVERPVVSVTQYMGLGTQQTLDFDNLV